MAATVVAPLAMETVGSACWEVAAVLGVVQMMAMREFAL